MSQDVQVVVTNTVYNVEFPSEGSITVTTTTSPTIGVITLGIQGPIGPQGIPGTSGASRDNPLYYARFGGV